MNQYYVYTHLNPTTKDVFYVGIGKKNRAFNQWAGRNKFWENYVNKHGFEVEIIQDNLTRKQAEKIEMELISHLGRRQIDEGGVLVNRSIGGDGNKGYTHTQEFKLKMSKDRKGKCTRKINKLTEESKKKISKALKGREVTWGKKVLQYDKKGNFIREWDSMKEAEKATGAKAIFEVASGYKNNLYKSSGGFIWKYKN
jgi:hypothetical protein